MSSNITHVYIDDKQKKIKIPSGTRLLVRRACKATLKFESFPYPAEVSVLFVDDDEIHRLNYKSSNIKLITNLSTEVYKSVENVLNSERFKKKFQTRL